MYDTLTLSLAFKNAIFKELYKNENLLQNSTKNKASVKYQTPNFVRIYIFYKPLTKFNYTSIFSEI